MTFLPKFHEARQELLALFIAIPVALMRDSELHHRALNKVRRDGQIGRQREISQSFVLPPLHHSSARIVANTSALSQSSAATRPARGCS